MQKKFVLIDFYNYSIKYLEVKKMKRYIYLLFFGVSLILSVMMFIQLADNLIGKVVMVIAAISFEIGKILLWIQYKEKKYVSSFIVCMLFVALSISASISFTVGLMKNQYIVSESALSTQIDINQIDNEISALTKTINELDPKYISAKIKLSNRVDDLRNIKENKKQISNSESKSSQAAIVFKDMANILHCSPVVLMFIFFSIFSILLESGALLLCPIDEVDPDADLIANNEIYNFGKKLYQGDNEPLRGYLSVSKEIGITERRGRTMYENFKKMGLTFVNGKYTYPQKDYLERLKNL